MDRTSELAENVSRGSAWVRDRSTRHVSADGGEAVGALGGTPAVLLGTALSSFPIPALQGRDSHSRAGGLRGTPDHVEESKRVRNVYLRKSRHDTGFPGGSEGKHPPASAGDTRDWVRSLGGEDSPGGGNGNPLQYSCLGNPKVRGAWVATVHGVTESNTTELAHACRDLDLTCCN